MVLTIIVVNLRAWHPLESVAKECGESSRAAGWITSQSLKCLAAHLWIWYGLIIRFVTYQNTLSQREGGCEQIGGWDEVTSHGWHLDTYRMYRMYWRLYWMYNIRSTPITPLHQSGSHHYFKPPISNKLAIFYRVKLDHLEPEIWFTVTRWKGPLQLGDLTWPHIEIYVWWGTTLTV